MADFVAVIRKAVDNLSENTADNRVKVYDKARAAIRRQLEAISPKPSEDVIARQLEKLDVAIREVESEHAEALPAEEEETDRLMAELEALVEQGKPIAPPVSAPPVSAPPVSAPVAAPQPAPAYAPKPAPAPGYPSAPAVAQPTPDQAPPVAAPPRPGFTAAEAYRPAPIQPAPPVFEPKPYPTPKPMPYRDEPMVAVAPPPRPAAPPAQPVSFDVAADKPPFITGDDHDDAFGLNEPRQPRSEPRRMAQKPKKKSGGLGWVLGAAVLLLLAGAGYAAWSQRDALTAMFGGGDAPTPVATPASTDPATPAAPTETAAAPDSAATPADDGKFTQRLNPDGTETDAGPAPEAGDTGPVEGRSVAALTDTGPVDTGDPATSAPTGEDEATNGETADAAPAQPDPATPAAVAPIGVSQKMFLYEERLDQQSPAVTDGAVVWSEIEETDANGRADVAIRGEISAGADGLTALVTIKRNLDSSLPASHIIEIVFALPPGFAGGSVDQVQRINMKQTEQDQGEALIAVPAQITPDFYMVALNDLKEAVDTNLRLLRERSWIDIPIVYANGRRALLTLEKGTSGSEVFTKVLDAWTRG